jgi:hypothetical protein
MLIYVAGPYTAPDDEGRIANTQRAMQAGLVILGRGHTPFIPHFTHYFDLYVEKRLGLRLPSNIYYDWDMVILDRCDALLYLAPSPGADKELERASELGLVVFYSEREIPFGNL